MKKMLFPLAMITLIACQQQPEKKAIPLPNTPETVAQQWIEAFYKDSFALALQLSTAGTQEMIETLRKELIPDTENIVFEITNMHCEVQGDSATCDYIYREELERFEEFISLVREKNQWLVDERLSDELEPKDLELLREEIQQLMEQEK